MCILLKIYYRAFHVSCSRLRVFEVRVRRRDEVTGSGEDYIMKSFMICTSHDILSGRSKQEELDGRGM